MKLQILNTQNILGIEYCKALPSEQPDLPITITGRNEYHETTVPEGNSIVLSPDFDLTDLLCICNFWHTKSDSSIPNRMPWPPRFGTGFSIFQAVIPVNFSHRKFSGLYSFLLPYERKCKSLSSYMDVSKVSPGWIINQQKVLLSFSQSVSAKTKGWPNKDTGHCYV